MALQDIDKTFAQDTEGASVRFRPPPKQESDIDMTPMIDCVFQLLIFFLVGSIPDYATAVELAPARHGKGADPNTAVIITVADTGAKDADVFLADGKIGAPLTKDPKAQQTAISEAVREGQQNGKSGVILKAQRSVKFREVNRVASAVALVEDMRLYFAVLESK